MLLVDILYFGAFVVAVYLFAAFVLSLYYLK